MSRKNNINIGYAICLVLLAANIVNSTPLAENSNTSKVDTSILEKLKNQTFVEVRIFIDDELDEGYPSLNDRVALHDALVKATENKVKKQSEILSSFSFSTDEFNMTSVSKMGYGFSGWISKKGLAKLVSNHYVVHIYEPIYGEVALPESVPLIQANSVWNNLSYAGEGQAICIIDTGINRTHPDLANKTLKEKCYCSVSVSGPGGGCCPDTDTEGDNAADDYGHGTHVAGIAVANGSLKGVAPGAKLVVIKAVNASGNWKDEDIEKAVNFCRLNATLFNISVISISLATNEVYSPSWCDGTTLGSSINSAVKEGILVTISSGNDGKNGLSSPACTSNATSVGASYDANIGSRYYCFNWLGPICTSSCTDNPTSSDVIYCPTDRNASLDLLAPGCNITSTAMNGGNTSKCGTSMAAPHVAGAAVILKEINNELMPWDMEYILKQSGTSIYDSQTGNTFPRINVYQAALWAKDSLFFNVSNSGVVDLNVTFIDSPASWVYNIHPVSFVLSANQSQRVMVTVDVQDTMPIGSYSTDLIVFSNDPDEPEKNVPLVYERVKPGCTGVSPPGSGDWIITTYTACWTNDTLTNGIVSVQNNNTLFLGELKANVTGQVVSLDGSLKLDDAELMF
jgi:subtilisin family serine protease